MPKRILSRSLRQYNAVQPGLWHPWGAKGWKKIIELTENDREEIAHHTIATHEGSWANSGRSMEKGIAQIIIDTKEGP